MRRGIERVVRGISAVQCCGGRLGFIELRSHTAFSFGDGVLSPESLVGRAASMGYGALGLTDHVDLGGIIRFTLAAEQAGVKPVVGAELEVDGHPVALLARDAEGYRNLAALVTASRVGQIGSWVSGEDTRAGRGAFRGDGARDGTDRGEGDSERERVRSAVIGSAVMSHSSRAHGVVSVPYAGLPSGRSARDSASLSRRYAVPLPDRGRPALTFEDLIERSEGLWCLTGPAAGEFATYVRTGRSVEAAYRLDRWREVFGLRLAVEGQLHHAGGHEAALAGELIELAERGRVRWVATNDPRYLDGAGRLAHDLLTANRAGVCVNTAAAWGQLLPNGEWRLKSPAEMAQLWRGRESGLEATRDVADDCAAFDLRWLRPPLPGFPVPAGHDDDTWLRELVHCGARRRWGEVDERQRAQLDHELGVIRRLGFAGFFLVMWDAVRHARSRHILCQGRGSAANSAVAYCLEITAVDPVRHGLLFERFLSEVRTDGGTEAPDIDVDFEMHRREEVLDYMYDTYRRQHAAITAVTQVFHAPTALQDVMRALGYPAEFAYRFSKRLHGLDPSEGVEALRGGLAREYGLDLEDARGRTLLTAMGVLDDVPRLRSTHPGGFVLSSEPLGDYMPIEHTTMGRTILQFDKDDLDAAGVPKFDFLGLGGLSAVHLAFDAIEKRTGEKLELYRLPVDDARTYELISRGDTVGTFQIESRAQIQSILATRPERLYDIAVQVALIRPGPIQAKFVHPYTERRRGRQPVRYAHPLLEPILRRTYGVPIFQEQAMAISMALAGFSAGEADELRRAMGHQRKVGRLKAALDRMRSRCIERGVSKEVADEVVTDLLSFANYGFPESHAWSFALISYATAWLKANHPAEFFLGLLNAWPMGFYPPATLVHDARRCGVRVVGPCLRDGAWECEVIERHGEAVLRIGWKHIQGLGESARETLQLARVEGPFRSIGDVVKRAGLTRSDAFQLARAGAFEAFQPGRRKAAWEALKAAGDLLPLAPARALPFNPRELEGDELVFLDYLATGISTHGHPMEFIRARLDVANVIPSRDLGTVHSGERIVVAGLVVARQHPATAKGTVFVLLEDEWGFLNVIVPKDTYARYRETVNFSPFLVVEGRFEREDRVVNIIGWRFRELRLRSRTREPVKYRSRDFH